MKHILSIVLFFVGLTFSQNTFSQEMNSLIIVYNNIASDNNLRCDWGYSAWIEIGDEIVLFDTGAKPGILAQNFKKLNLNPEKISVIAISHGHYDHIGGIESVLSKLKKKTKVYLPGDPETNFKESYPDLKFMVNNKYQKIAKNVWLTKVFQNNIPEQALIIENKKKIIMITGCAHPGIVVMCESVRKYFPNKKMELLTGGFHLRGVSEKEVEKISNELKQLGIEKIAPSHCTGDQSIQILKDTWNKKFIPLNLGDSYRF